VSAVAAETTPGVFVKVIPNAKKGKKKYTLENLGLDDQLKNREGGKKKEREPQKFSYLWLCMPQHQHRQIQPWEWQ